MSDETGALTPVTDALLAHAFEAATIGLALMDASGRTVRVNPRLTELLGRPAQEIIDRGVQQVVGEGVAATGGSELEITRADGSVVHVRVALVPLADPDGRTTGVLAQFRDVTGREDAAAREGALQAELAATRATAARHLADLRRVVGIQQALSDDADVRQAVCDVALEIGGALCAVVFEPDGAEWLRATASAGLGDLTINLHTDQPSGPAQVLASGEPLYVGDAPSDPAVSQALVARVGIGSALYQPVVRDGEIVAVLALGWRETRPAVDDRVVAAAELLATDLAVGLRRAEHLAALEAATALDPETGLLNARGWDGALFLQLERSRRSQESVCVALIELDAAVVVAARLPAWREALRATDALGRVADARVAVVLPGCALPAARLVLERMEPGAAIGVAQWDGEESPERLLRRADADLYEALARSAAVRLHDPARVAAVQEVVAAGHQPLLHELAEAAATAVEASAAAVSLVTDAEQRLAGHHGMDSWPEHGTPIDYSFCQYPAVTGRPLVVSDAREHPLVRDNPAVEDLDVVAYAGIPLRGADGHVLGALCAIDQHPRVWHDADIDVLSHFAELAAVELQRLRDQA